MGDLSVEDVFEMREPPSAGLTRLRARLDEAERGARVIRGAIAIAALAGIAAVVLGPAPETVRLESSPGLVRIGSETPPEVPVAPADRALAILAVDRTEDVVFYRVARVPGISDPR